MTAPSIVGQTAAGDVNDSAGSLPELHTPYLVKECADRGVT